MTQPRSVTSHPHAVSLWETTASEWEPLGPLTESIRTDVLVIGAGYTGLSTALHLAEKNVGVCVLDAFQPGWGASGRNGGQVNPTFKHDPNQLREKYRDRADRLIETISTSADLVFELISKYRIACDPIRAGWMQLSYSEAGIDALYKRARQWEVLGTPVRYLDRQEVQSRTGTHVFSGGWLDQRAGSVQPLSYARGLAHAAIEKGVSIYGHSPVLQLQKQKGKWLATLNTGVQIEANQVVIGTNGYSDALWPGLAKTVLSANSFIVATEPLGERAAHILAAGETFSTAQRLLVYLRKDKEGRLILGGRGKFSDPTGADGFAHLERSLSLLYPEFGQLSFSHRWAGRIAITQDFMPHVHQPEGGLTIALGYNGRGIAAATSMGKNLAELLTTQDGALNFPYPITAIKPIPFHSLQRFYITAGVAWYGLQDRFGK